MEIIRKDGQQQHTDGNLTAFEYPTKDKDINGAVTQINGRYPTTGWLKNEVCKELIYVLEGSGTLTLKDNSVSFTAGDMIILPANEEYYWEGTMKHVVATTPPWYAEQHKNII